MKAADSSKERSPQALCGHTAVTFLSSMYLFGGIMGKEGISNSIFELELDTYAMSPRALKKFAKGVDPIATNEPVTEKFGTIGSILIDQLPNLVLHTSCIYGSEMVIFGGTDYSSQPCYPGHKISNVKDNGPSITNSLFVCSLKTFQARILDKWSKKALEFVPLPRAGHSACVFGRRMVVFGGHTDDLYMN